MGLTIDYQLSTRLSEPSDIRRLMKLLRQHARDLPFEEVGPVVEFDGEDTQFQRGKKDPHAWFKIKSGTMIKRRNAYHSVKALHIIGFETWPGDGCESATFCLARYPATIQCETSSGRLREIPTRLQGWRYGSTCKTQYAANPKNGGVEHFLRCHLCVIKLLDFIKQSGLVEVKVRDGGGYWRHRDLGKLIKRLQAWNELVAAVVGGLDELIGKRGVRSAPIAEFADYEHLEAKGLARLRKLLSKKRKRKSD